MSGGNANFNRLTANDAKIDDLTVSDIKLTGNNLPSISTDSPFNVGDVLVTKTIKTILVVNSFSKLSDTKIETLHDNEFIAKVEFNKIIDDNDLHTTYLCNFETKTGRYYPNIIYTFNKRLNRLSHVRNSVPDGRNEYEIYWFEEKDLGIMARSLSHYKRQISEWKRV
uniref:Uncharacterized protein n=1 Tax=viral metagenome TaxID=1070528 RepID=A0A6C0LHX1_9ZZZZ